VWRRDARDSAAFLFGFLPTLLALADEVIE
jgi:hypothetical protein